jgi:hypothetical protein
MNGREVQVRELAGWDLDEDEYRPKSLDPGRLAPARALVAQRSDFQTVSAIVDSKAPALLAGLAEQESRSDLGEEFDGLEWSLGVIDLRFLLAFQRRLVLTPGAPQLKVPVLEDWRGLLELAFGPSKAVTYDLSRDGALVVIESSNPNLHFRLSGDAASPLKVHGGSPFFEVARFRGRWFLRDGYHRAYALLRAGIFHLPAVVVEAKSLAELGALHPWFFPEDVLFSSTPPRVTDFLDDALVLEYDRTPFIKTLRLTMEEILTPAISSGENR